jgi:hypothetical protein
MVRLNNTPPAGALPDVDDAIAELLALRDREREARAEMARLSSEAPGSRSTQLDVEAAAADKALLAEAARRGEPTDGIGTPNADALAAERLQARRDVEAISAAVVDATDDLVDAIRKHEAKLQKRLAGQVDKAASAYEAAVDAVAAKRHAFVEALAVRDFVERVLAAGHDTMVSYTVSVAESLPSDTPHPVRPESAFAALKGEAARKGRRGPKVTAGAGRFTDQFGYPV